MRIVFDVDDDFRCECGEFKFHKDSHCIDCLKNTEIRKKVGDLKPDQ